MPLNAVNWEIHCLKIDQVYKAEPCEGTAHLTTVLQGEDMAAAEVVVVDNEVLQEGDMGVSKGDVRSKIMAASQLETSL